MGSRRGSRLMAVVLTTAFLSPAMADNEPRRVVVRYRLKNASAEQVGGRLAPLFQGRQDIRISIPATIGAGGREQGNELLVLASKEDHVTIGAFLALVDRQRGSALLFPEEVERAMMGDAFKPRTRDDGLKPRTRDERVIPFKPADNPLPLPRKHPQSP